MPKRNSSEKENIVKKLRKLEQKLEKYKSRRIRVISSSSDDSQEPLQDNNDGDYLENYTEVDSLIEELNEQQETNINNLSCSQEGHKELVTEGCPEEDIRTEETELDSDILEILGQAPSSSVTYGKDIRSELATRLNHIATNGLNKETRKDLSDKYLIPGNCTLIGAPELNPEVKIALNEYAVKRDKLIEFRQKRLAAAISCISEALSCTLNSKEKDNAQIKRLMDATRIMCDIQYNESVTRRKNAVFSIKKDMKEPLLKTQIDKSLFGESLNESIKVARTINRSGTELKTFTQSPTQLKNWKTPVAGRRPPATSRRGAPVPVTSAVQRSRPATKELRARAPEQLSRRPLPQQNKYMHRKK